MLIVSFLVQKLLSLIRSHLFIFALISNILAIFVKDKVSIGAWIYLWAFYFVPLIYMHLEKTHETPPSSRNEGLLFLPDLESNPESSLQNEEEAGLP